MISVLVMARDSILADAIVSILEHEIDLDVVRLPRHELDKGNQYSLVIIVDEEDPKEDAIEVADLFREHNTLLVLSISLTSNEMYVYERHQLNNPDMELMMQIVRDFSRKNLTMNPDDDTSPQKKMNRVGHVPPREYTRQNVNVPVTYLFRIAQAANPNQNLNFLFPLHVRRKYLGIVTLISRMHAKN